MNKTNKFNVGVQWHPEDLDNDLLFKEFIKSCIWHNYNLLEIKLASFHKKQVLLFHKYFIRLISWFAYNISIKYNVGDLCEY